MAEEEGFLSEQSAGAEIGKLLAEETPPEDVKEVKFKARVKPRKAKAVDDADKEIVAMEPADGSPDPDRELDDDANPYKNEKRRAKKDEPVEDEPEDEDEQDGGGEDDGDEQPVRTLKVKVDGLEKELPEDEVVKGYSRTADYTRKTQALAEERKRFVAEEVEPTRQARAEYLERLHALDAIVPNPGKEPDWDALQNRLTPEEFQQQFTEWRVMRDRHARVQQERERVMHEQVEDERRALRARLADEQEKLMAVFPEWGTEKGKALRGDLIDYAKSLKFSDDDLATVTDHRLLVLLDKARRYDQAQQRKPKIEDKIDRALDTLKPSATKSKPKFSETQRLEAQLAKTGSVDDAAKLISKLL